MKRSGPIQRKKPLRSSEPNRVRPKVQIRQLQPGEAIPAGEPKRYANGAGYVRLRWKVAPNEYVEVYEHRLAAGLPTGMDVHHRNEAKGDNQPENLRPLTKREHGAIHSNAGQRSYGRYRSREAMEKAQRAEDRRRRRRDLAEGMAELYRQGATTVEIGREFGLDASGVSRLLRASGVRMRGGRGGTFSSSVKSLVHARDGMKCVRCERDCRWIRNEVHHRRPRGMGGSHDSATNGPGNLVLLCGECHGWTERNRVAAREVGLLLGQSCADPSSVPVMRFGRMVRLDNDGGVSLIA